MNIIFCQANKLRFLLQQWERRTEDYNARLSEAFGDRDKILSEYDQLLQAKTRYFI
jgi:hypothetical protein